MSAQDEWARSMADLRRPFTAAAVKFKPLTKPNDGKSSAAFYIDARLVAERLNAAVGPGEWSDDYSLIAEGRETPALYYPIVCRLTVLGVTKSDVGQGANTVLDEKAWKSAYSDALKRAAVKFGIGAYLYGIPRLYAAVTVGNDGKAKGFTNEGKSYLLGKYQAWLKSPLNTFGDPLDHGDIADEDDEPEALPVEKAGTAQVGEIERLIAELNRENILTEALVRDGMLKEYGTELTAELSKQQATEFAVRLSAKASQLVTA